MVKQTELPRYSILVTEDLLEVGAAPGTRLILEMRPDGLPALFGLTEVARGFVALLAAIDAGTAKPDHSGAALSDLRASLAQLAAHERSCERVSEGLPVLEGSNAWHSAFEDFRPDERGRCCCPHCELARSPRRLKLVR